MNPELAVLLALHLLFAVIWVGGMAFAWLCLRPAAGETLASAYRARLWQATLSRFFAMIWFAAPGLALTGYRLASRLYGPPDAYPWHVAAMHIAAWVMIALFLIARFVPYRRLERALTADDAASAAAAMGGLRRVVGANLLVGVAVVLVAGAGRYLAV